MPEADDEEQEEDTQLQALAIVLLVMSLATWVVILAKALNLRRHARASRQIESFWHAADFADAAHLTRTFYQMVGMAPSALMRGDFVEIASPFNALPGQAGEPLRRRPAK